MPSSLKNWAQELEIDQKRFFLPYHPKISENVRHGIFVDFFFVRNHFFSSEKCWDAFLSFLTFHVMSDDTFALPAVNQGHELVYSRAPLKNVIFSYSGKSVGQTFWIESTSTGKVCLDKDFLDVNGLYPQWVLDKLIVFTSIWLL